MNPAFLWAEDPLQGLREIPLRTHFRWLRLAHEPLPILGQCRHHLFLVRRMYVPAR
jgi:hypothetical protein